MNTYRTIKRFLNCKHSNLQLFNEYFNLYRCNNCDTYWTPTKEFKNKIQLSYTNVVFSDEDDRIINVWCEDLVQQEMKDMKNGVLTKEQKKFNKWASKMYPKLKTKKK